MYTEHSTTYETQFNHINEYEGYPLLLQKKKKQFQIKTYRESSNPASTAIFGALKSKNIYT